MSKPTKGAMARLKRFGRYLVDKQRLVQPLSYQPATKYIDVWVDTDFAGCKKTRKSTSGGIITIGGHIIKSWSSTQNVVALSSGEAEYYGMVKGASMALVVRSVLGDLGYEMQIRLRTDASAAKGIASRRGLGKVRHIEVNQLWLQEKVSSGEIEVMKVKGLGNLADALTKALDGPGIKHHLELTKQCVTSGRHRLTPKFESATLELESDALLESLEVKPKELSREDIVRLFRLYHNGDILQSPQCVIPGAPWLGKCLSVSPVSLARLKALWS